VGFAFLKIDKNMDVCWGREVVFEIKNTYSKVYASCEAGRPDVKNCLKFFPWGEGRFLGSESVKKREMSRSMGKTCHLALA
jgi:hypothetical protein